jgi:peroxiredoxin
MPASSRRETVRAPAPHPYKGRDRVDRWSSGSRRPTSGLDPVRPARYRLDGLRRAPTLAGPSLFALPMRVAICPQTPDGSLSTRETKELTFTVLSDPGNQIAGQLGILTGPSECVRAAQLQLGLDLTKVNADGTTALPMPTVIIVDSARVIRWMDARADYTTRTEPDQVLQAIAHTVG